MYDVQPDAVTLGWDVKRIVKAATELAQLADPAHVDPLPEREDDDDDDRDERLANAPDTAWKPFRSKRRVPGKGGDTWEDYNDWTQPTRTTPQWEDRLLQLVDGYSGYSNTEWMDMKVLHPYLVRPKWAKGVGCTDTGDVFRAPHRLVCDQKVFRMNRAKRTGSLLIDASGSMALEAEDIRRIVMSVPAAVIAFYSGISPYNGNLKIVAKGGLLVKDDEEYERDRGDYNGVDGPALRWLAMQPRPRIWISDGIVTGVNDSPSPNLFRDAANICEHYRILRVGSLQEAQRLL